jgi:hypothetical protein
MGVDLDPGGTTVMAKAEEERGYPSGVDLVPKGCGGVKGMLDRIHEPGLTE